MIRKPLIWVASSKKDLSEFPKEVRREMGFGLHQAQMGRKSEKAKPLKGFGSADILGNSGSGCIRNISCGLHGKI